MTPRPHKCIELNKETGQYKINGDHISQWDLTLEQRRIVEENRVLMIQQGEFLTALKIPEEFVDNAVKTGVLNIEFKKGGYMQVVAPQENTEL